jgi:alpha-beta hydrolase superfamily lysophospholipase
MLKTITLTSQGENVAANLIMPDGSHLPAIILCHGAGEFKENYLALGNFLAEKGIASLALDMYGHGASSGERHVIDIARWVGDIHSACDFLETLPQIDPLRIAAFGLSSGGTAVLEAALVEPRLKALVALDATVRNSFPLQFTLAFKALETWGWVHKLFTGREWRIPMSQWLGAGEVASDPLVNARLLGDTRVQEAGKSYPLPGGAPSFFVHTIRRVSQIDIPVRIIWGAEDKVDSPETAWRLFQALTCKKDLHIIASNGHMGHLDRNRETVYALVADWVLTQM